MPEFRIKSAVRIEVLSTRFTVGNSPIMWDASITQTRKTTPKPAWFHYRSQRRLDYPNAEKCAKTYTVSITDVKRKEKYPRHFTNRSYLNQVQKPWCLLPKARLSMKSEIRPPKGCIRLSILQLKWKKVSPLISRQEGVCCLGSRGYQKYLQ